MLYGPTPGSPDAAISVSGAAIAHAVQLQGLYPGVDYYYRVASDPDTFTSDEEHFRTAPDAVEPFRFLAFGDLGRATPEQIQVAARIDSLNADLAILTGDIIYEYGEAANFTPQYFDIYKPTIARIPFYPSLGNHDVVTLNGQPYLDAFYLPSNNPAGTERYYSFDYSNAHFACLEVDVKDTPPDAAMLSWLDQDLAASTQTWKFVFFHIPMYSNGGTHGADAVISSAVEPILNAHGADVVFQGHNHYYTRTFPIYGGVVVGAAQDPTYVNPGGAIYIVTGGAGRFLHALGTSPAYEVFSKSTFHVTSVDVAGNTITLQAIERDGTVMDTMTLTKDLATAVTLTDFWAESTSEGVRLRWRSPDNSGVLGFHVYRGDAPSKPTMRLTQAPIFGGPDYSFLDATAEPGREYAYGLGAVNAHGGEERIGLVVGRRASLPFAIQAVRPNPSKRTSEVHFSLDRSSKVTVRIYDPLGRLVRVLERGVLLGPGRGAVVWDGKDDRGSLSPAGLYLAEVRSEDRCARTKILRLR